MCFIGFRFLGVEQRLVNLMGMGVVTAFKLSE